MKRFWREVAVIRDGRGFAVALDGRPVKTPARAAFAVPTGALAEAIAAEWDAQGDAIEPESMPLFGLANAAIDRVAPEPRRFAATLARYAEGDLLCYRAEEPETLARRQAVAWDPLLQWARRRFDVDFAVGTGVVHVMQPQATVTRLAQAVMELDPWRMAALSPLVTIGGSLIAALAAIEGASDPEQAWAAVSLDEAWQLEKWGSDALAEAALDARRGDFLAAARFVELLGG